ncbi:hypothetical protein D5R55_07225 [Burkholderia cenocepacia]|uniref:Uncharacterized protein n=1 Tax=Burkholderia cenocepacia TaxID=95486 RepID=A0A3Q9F212_9BURK|nr:hypothetical protein D5R55_07225 [Burkholderia cenocepacia]
MDEVRRACVYATASRADSRAYRTEPEVNNKIVTPTGVNGEAGRLGQLQAAAAPPVSPRQP